MSNIVQKLNVNYAGPVFSLSRLQIRKFVLFFFNCVIAKKRIFCILIQAKF